MTTGRADVERFRANTQRTELFYLHSPLRQLNRYLEREGPSTDRSNATNRWTCGRFTRRSKGRHRVAVLAPASGRADELPRDSKYAANGDRSGADADAAIADG